MSSGGLLTSSGKPGGVATDPFVTDGAMMGSTAVAGRECLPTPTLLRRRRYQMEALLT